MIFIVLFSFIYEKHIQNYKINQCVKAQETYLIDIITKLRCSFVISSKDKILFKNMFFEELMKKDFKNIIEEKHFELEAGNFI